MIALIQLNVIVVVLNARLRRVVSDSQQKINPHLNFVFILHFPFHFFILAGSF